MNDTRPRIAVVDYGAGNLVSIEQGLTASGAEVVDRPRSGTRSMGADAIVVPGVGAAAPAMDRLRDAGFVDPIVDWIAADKPFLGVCLGLQLLFEASDEDGAQTFGVLPGRRATAGGRPDAPAHRLEPGRPAARPPALRRDRRRGRLLLRPFVRGGAGGRPPTTSILAETEHGARFVSAVARGNLLGVQFHPERSGDDGLRLLANFVSLVRAGGRAPAGVAS